MFGPHGPAFMPQHIRFPRLLPVLRTLRPSDRDYILNRTLMLLEDAVVPTYIYERPIEGDLTGVWSAMPRMGRWLTHTRHQLGISTCNRPKP